MKYFIISALLLFCLTANAQIGYQVSLLNTATGEPRANETVTVEITLTDAKGTVIFTDTRNSTTNDFGTLSLSVGNENTFNEIDASRLPLYISASIGGVLISKSQVLSVPVAEYAKKSGILTKELLQSKTWKAIYYMEGSEGIMSFSEKSMSVTYYFEGLKYVDNFEYSISGNVVCAWNSSNRYHNIFVFMPEFGQFLCD